jgi:hypothetical protein
MSHTIKEIRFSTNWNNKLYSNIFATLRFGECKYEEGEQVNILLRKEGAYISTGFGIIQGVYKDVCFKHLYWYLPIDTGYSFNESLNLFKNFNHNLPIEDDTPINVIVISRLKQINLTKNI